MWQIREDIKKGVYVENLKEVEVTNARDVIQQLIQVYNVFIFALQLLNVGFQHLLDWCWFNF